MTAAPDMRHTGKPARPASWIRNRRDAGAGLIFLGFGGLAVALATNYRIGTMLRMGPGYFPLLIGGLLIVFGLILLVRGLAAKGAPIPKFRLRPAVCILASVIVFAVTVKTLGIILASILTVFVSRLGDWSFSPLESLMLGTVLAMVSAGIFVVGLGIPFSLGPF